MKRFLLLLIIGALLAACGGGQPDTAERLVGKWSGLISNDEGGTFPSDWEFTEDGKMIVVIAPGALNVVQTATYYFDDDGALRIVADDAEEGATPGRRVVEFVTDDTVKLTAENSGIVTTLTRVEEE